MNDHPTINNPSFQACEDAIGLVARRLSGVPQQEVLLTRLYFHVQGYLTDYFNAGLKEHGINDTIWMALMMLYTRPDETVYPSDLSESLAFSRTNATRVVDDLVGQGWAVREACADDRRKTRLILTPAGRAFIENLMPSRHAHMSELWNAFSDTEKVAMESLLRKLLAQLGG
ncbi:MarR family transcriptional regulator [Crenobacter cavernae]|uniref:MarR family transcriptional regulator n=1 Tax=Crenobacter cavernae TaxID=2290923 RepID=A0ABY0FGD2_9NEIS|nr:MarR family transcriptional regulator [Crenobacter cavernae]RXZ45443.1 MarR family transcriptional regulator [Crenobacter cavernae]